MAERQGRFGPFKSCSDYPRCKGPQKAAGPRLRREKVKV
ncbi:MAG: hypothetical protein DLM66_07650 [Candidatus Dormiibacter spiritus]|nr:MAG: hypothetical protein DLM66_07650 [Candidatus Dormibacteraeota bacterium]